MEEEEDEQLPKLMEVEDSKEDEAEQPAPGFNMVVVKAKFVVAQAKEMTKQSTILESIDDEAEVEANPELLRQKQAKNDKLFTELKAYMEEEEEEEAGAKQSDAPEDT
ncbi:Cysteinyl-tRNA synthetase [Hordeum vulgare]|nr:Cysteinyl-tRNA synthetase [Hordeum vulgare]